MLETNVMSRGSGKTQKVIDLMSKDRNYLLIVPLSHMKKLYPSEIQQRIFTFNDVLSGGVRGIRFEKIIIDEGFLDRKEKLAHLYYFLGKNNINTIVYGTE